MERNNNEKLNDANLALLEARNDLEDVIHAVSDSIIVMDNENKVLFLNRSAEIYLDKNLLDCMQQPVIDCFSEDILAEKFTDILDSDRDMINGDDDHSVVPGELRYQGRIEYDENGVGRVLYVCLHSLRAGKKALIFSDISELLAAYRMKSNVSGLISHELRTPLTIMMGYLDYLVMSKNRDDLDTILEEVRKETRRLHGRIENLLLLTRIGAGKESLRAMPVTVGSLKEYIISMGKKRAEAKGISLIVSAPSDKEVFVVDESKITQIVGNLVDNAVRHSPDNSRVEIMIYSTSDSYVFSVIDEGPGIPADKAEKIFDDFVQGSEKSSGGLGLGLTICRHLARIHGGRIDVKSSPGKGAVFSLNVPKPPVKRKLNILIADDSPSFRELISAIFRKKTYIQTIPVENGVLALRYLEEHRAEVDLVFLDMNMPMMDGLETLKHIRSMEPNMPVVIITGASDEKLAWEGGKLGANAYISKPCKTEEILKVAENLLDISDNDADTGE